MKVTGHVVDAQDGKPVKGALVRLFDHQSALLETQSNSDGEFTLHLDLDSRPELLGRPAQVKASLDGYGPAHHDLDIQQATHDLRFEIQSSPEPLEVLINRLDGSPLEAAAVHLATGGKVWDEAVTDHQGIARFTVPPERLNQQPLLKVSKQGWYAVERLVFLKRNMPPMQVTLEPSDTEKVPLGGRVLDDEGNPVEGAWVRLEIPSQEAIGLVTDAHGRWDVVLGKDTYGGEALLSATHPDFHPMAGVKLPLAPNAMHVLPLEPLVATSPRAYRWLWILAAVAMAIGIARWMLS